MKRKCVFEPPPRQVQGWVGRAASLQRLGNVSLCPRVNFAMSKFTLSLCVSPQVSGNRGLVVLGFFEGFFWQVRLLLHRCPR